MTTGAFVGGGGFGKGGIVVAGSQNATSQTTLGQRLSFPFHIRHPYLGCLSVVGIVLFVLGLIVIALSEPSADNKVIPIIVFSFLFLIPGALLFIIPRTVKRRRIARERPIVDLAYANWNKLFYCARNDIVFYPETGQYVDISEMNKILL